MLCRGNEIYAYSGGVKMRRQSFLLTILALCLPFAAAALAGEPFMLKDIRPGASSSYPENLTDVNGTLFFQANDGTTGVELWKSDGTSAGTVLVKDIYPGTGGSNPSYLTYINGTLFFNAADSTYGYELWKSDTNN